MKKLLYPSLVVLICSCGQTQINQLKPATAVKPHPGKFDKLLAKYKDVSFDTIRVFPSENVENDKYKFKGIHLDSSEIQLLTEGLSETYVNDDGYFACYKFPIDKNRMALITRTPSTYEPTSIRMMIFENEKNKITGNIELAETFGDAGDAATKTSWLFKDGNDQYKCFTWIWESHHNIVDDDKDSTVDTWNYYYLIDISKPVADTLSKDEQDLLKKFGSLIK